MRTFLLVLLIPVVALAGEKDPKVLSKQASESAEKFFAEAKAVAERAATATKEEAADLNEYAELTLEEGKQLLKASEAWGNNQIRLAERYTKKAGEYCDKRGKLLDKVYGKCEDKDSKKAEDKYSAKKESKPADKDVWKTGEKDDAAKMLEKKSAAEAEAAVPTE